MLGRLRETWRSWSARRRAVTVALVVAVAAGLGVLAYELLKRPADVSDPGVDFARNAEREPQQKRKPRDETANWPTYGLNDARTRYFPTKEVVPPFGSSDWSFQAGKLLEFSPILVDDRLYVMDIDATFYAINAKRGKLAWKRDLGSLNATSAAYANGRLFAVNMEPGQAVALKPETGKLLWKTKLPGRSESSPLTYKDELVIFGCECGTVFALDQKSGKIRWTVDTNGPIKGALAAGKGNVYGGNYAGEFFAIDAQTGNEEWRISTSGGSFGRGGGVYSTPAVGWGRVYFGSIDSRVYSVDMDTGEIAWSKSTGAEVYSGPALAKVPGTRPTVYIGSADDNFYALDARTGSTRWQQNAGGDITGAASVVGDVVYVAVIGDAVGTIGYDVKDGDVVFRHELGEYNPVVTDGKRLYLTGYSNIRAFPPKQRQRKGKPTRRDGQKQGGRRTGAPRRAAGDRRGARKRVQRSGPRAGRSAGKRDARRAGRDRAQRSGRRDGDRKGSAGRRG